MIFVKRKTMRPYYVQNKYTMDRNTALHNIRRISFQYFIIFFHSARNNVLFRLLYSRYARFVIKMVGNCVIVANFHNENCEVTSFSLINIFLPSNLVARLMIIWFSVDALQYYTIAVRTWRRNRKISRKKGSPQLRYCVRCRVQYKLRSVGTYLGYLYPTYWIIIEKRDSG